MWVAWLAMLHHKACDFSRGLFTSAHLPRAGAAADNSATVTSGPAVSPRPRPRAMPESSLARARNAASSTISTAQAAISTPEASLAAPRASRADTQVLRIEHVGAHDFDLGALAVHGRESGETPSDAPPAAGHEGESHPAPELDRGGR